MKTKLFGHPVTRITELFISGVWWTARPGSVFVRKKKVSFESKWDGSEVTVVNKASVWGVKAKTREVPITEAGRS